MKYEKLSHLLILSICFILLIGCGKDDDNLTLVVPEAKQPYELADIQWALKDGDGQEIIEKVLPEKLFKNEGDATVAITFDPLANLRGSSTFEFELPEDLPVKLDSLKKIAVLSEINLLSEGYSHIGGGTKVPFRREEFNFPFWISIKETVDLKPKTQIRYQDTLLLKKNMATFKARFEQPETRESFELTGKWTGVFYKTLNGNAVFEEVK